MDALGLGREVTGSTTTHYTRTPDGELLGMRRGGSRYYFLLDGLGSVAAVVDQAGATAATYSYEPFGKLRASTGTLTNPYKWLGSLGVYSDDAVTGLYKMGTRWYDPALGRFTQVDPVEGGSANAYDYAGQNPINNADPKGMWCVFWYGNTCPPSARQARGVVERTASRAFRLTLQGFRNLASKVARGEVGARVCANLGRSGYVCATIRFRIPYGKVAAGIHGCLWGGLAASATVAPLAAMFPYAIVGMGCLGGAALSIRNIPGVWPPP